MYELEILEKVEAVSGKNDKFALLKSAATSKKLGALLNLALSYKSKFYINKFDDAPGVDAYVDRHGEFVALANRLMARQLSGNAAIAEVEALMQRCNKTQAKWYSRVLRRELLAGFSVDTAVRAGFDVPVFDVMLATDAAKCKDVKKVIGSGAYVSRKFDGYRLIARIDRGTVELCSREGEPYRNFPKLEAALKEIFPTQSLILDGEIMSDDFNSMQQSAFASTSGTAVGDMFFAIFDVVKLAEWDSDNFTTLYDQRYSDLMYLEEHWNNFPAGKMLRLVEQVRISDPKEAVELQHKYEVEGYEGAMLRPNCPYYRGKPKNKMLKFKSMVSMEATIVGIYEGENSNSGMLGGFHVMQENGVTCDVGGGFKKWQRKDFWNNPQTVIGRLIEVQYQELSADGVMRFPVFKRFRDQGKGKI